MNDLMLSGIYIYPIKSLGDIAVINIKAKRTNHFLVSNDNSWASFKHVFYHGAASTLTGISRKDLKKELSLKKFNKKFDDFLK